MDFCHKLNEVYYPHFNGDLKFGIISQSSLKRMFRKDTPFFKMVLLHCMFATKLDRANIIDAKSEKILPITEECLFIAAIRKRDQDPPAELETIFPGSLLLVYETMLQPTHIFSNATKFLFENDSEKKFSLVTCSYFNVVKLKYNIDELNHMYITMISHGELCEIRIENDNESKHSKIKRALIEAYQCAIKRHLEHHRWLVNCDAKIQFAYTCLNKPTVHHFLDATSAHIGLVMNVKVLGAPGRKQLYNYISSYSYS